MITVITVVYNGEKTIRDTLKSVCTQSVLPLEYIIVDGLSSDSTLDIVKEFMKEYPFIKLISEKDKGIYDAMNKGIEMASGELIGIINSDDWYEHNALEIMQNSYSTKGSGIHYGIQRNLIDDREFYLERSSQNFLSKRMIQHPSTFVSADVYKNNGAFDLTYKYSADLDLFLRFSDRKVPFYHVDNIIANFRIGGASSTPKAGLESLRVRKKYGFVTEKEYMFNLIRVKVKSLFNM